MRSLVGFAGSRMLCQWIDCAASDMRPDPSMMRRPHRLLHRKEKRHLMGEIIKIAGGLKPLSHLAQEQPS